MLKIGDVVKATSDITRKDRRSFLKEGELAKITAVWETENAQIVSVEIQGRLPMVDIVCFRNSKQPLEKVG